VRSAPRNLLKGAFREFPKVELTLTHHFIHLIQGTNKSWIIIVPLFPFAGQGLPPNHHLLIMARGKHLLCRASSIPAGNASILVDSTGALIFNGDKDIGRIGTGGRSLFRIARGIS
jgi:hypothetical protein